MKKLFLAGATALLAALALGGCAQTHTASNARPDSSQGRRTVTGSHIPRHVGRPIGSALANSNPYTHADDIDRDLGVTAPVTGATAGNH